MGIYKFNENKEKFAKKIKDLLEERKMTRQELSDITGISKPTIDNYCKASNSTLPSVENAYNIAIALKVSVEELLCVSSATNTNDDFYPNTSDITVNGIFKAVNYLLVAFGESALKTIELTESVIDYSTGYPTDVTIDVTAITFEDNDCGELKISPLDRYLKKIKESQNIRKELLAINEEKIYIEMLKKWADVENLDYNVLQGLYSTKTQEDELPF